MFRQFKYIVFILIPASIFFVSCKKPVKVSDIPQIKFVGVPIKDTVDALGNPIRRAKLTFSLIDGDGDIGLNNYDTVSPYNPGSVYYYNLYISLYTKVNGQMTLVPLTTPYYFRTPYIQPQGVDKVLQCTISVDLDFNLPVQWDSCEFKFYMYDRAKNKSNMASSGYRKLAP